MRNKFEKKILILVAVFYIFVSLMAVGILEITGVIGQRSSSILSAFNSLVDRRTDALETIHSELEGKGGKNYPAGMVPEEAEASSEAPSEEEPSLEDITEETEEAVQDDGVKYYAFTANNSAGRLNIRKEPSVRAKIVYRIHPGDMGYVLNIGDEWTEVSVDEKHGYCANEYLAIREIDAKDFPDELKESVGQAEAETEDNGT